MAITFRVKKLPWWHWMIAGIVGVIIVGALSTWALDRWEMFQQNITATGWEKDKLTQQVASIAAQLKMLKNEDQYKRNEALQGDIGHIEQTYTQAVTAYEDLLRLKDISRTTGKFDDQFAHILTLLAKHDYAGAGKELISFRSGIKTEADTIASSFVIPANVPASNTPPGSGYSSQAVSVDGTNFLVSLVAGDLSTTRVIVDTASNATCTNDCPVLALADYVSRSGAYAGVNGSYFCPASYPSCAGKTNSFDTLLMNKNKVYFNSDNNVYSTVPAAIFSSGSMRFVGRSSDWGRDTGVDGVIANQPLLLSGGNIAFGGGSDPKQGSKGARSFVGNKGSVAYIGVVQNATVAQVALVLKALGLENALNLDSGGSTALWSGGYKAGPGRAIPNAVLFVHK